MKNKMCIRCQKFKKKTEFGVNRSKSDKLDSYCKLCSVDIRKAQKRKIGSIYFDCKVGYNPTDAQLYIVHNCEICNEKFFPIRSNHKRCATCSHVARNIVHHSLMSERKTNKGWKCKVSPEAVVEVSKKYVHSNNCCYCCCAYSEDNPKSLDHILPICLGGKNDSGNINICCLKCNRSKAWIRLEDWIDLCRRVVANADKQLF